MPRSSTGSKDSPADPVGCRSRQVLVSQGRDRGSAESAGQQANAVQHDARGSAAVDDVLQRGLARLASSLEEAGQGVAGQTGHFHADEHHEQVIGRHHQAHADGGSQQQTMEIRGILAVRNAAQQRQADDQGHEGEQKQPQENSEVVEDQQTSKHRQGLVILRPGIQQIRRLPLQPVDDQGGETSGQGDAPQLPRPGTDYPQHQKQHNGRAQDQLRQERQDVQRQGHLQLLHTYQRNHEPYPICSNREIFFCFQGK